MKGWEWVVVWGFSEWSVEVRELVFGVLTVEVLCAICLWRLLSSTRSESKRPRVPTPAEDK